MSADFVARCRWFLNCPRMAVTKVAHPILGEVPCCAKCAAFARGDTGSDDDLPAVTPPATAPERPKLSPAQSKVIMELELAPLAWIGSNATGSGPLASRYAPCVILPASGEVKGLAFSEATKKVLIEKGLLKHGPLTEKQKKEFRWRVSVEDRRELCPTHGYQYTGRKR